MLHMRKLLIGVAAASLIAGAAQATELLSTAGLRISASAVRATTTSASIIPFRQGSAGQSAAISIW